LSRRKAARAGLLDAFQPVDCAETLQELEIMQQEQAAPAAA
jgi:hypothetical protein